MESPRREAEWAQVDKLHNLSKSLDCHSVPFIHDATLESLGIVRTRDLDIDHYLEDKPSYFCPYRGDEANLLEEETSLGSCWIETLDKDKDTNPEWVPNAPLVYPEAKSGWFLLRHDAVRQDVLDAPVDRDDADSDSEGEPVEPTTGYFCPIPSNIGYAMPVRGLSAQPGEPTYFSNTLFLPRSQDRPHAAAMVLDAAIGQEDAALLSEVDAAAKLIINRLASGEFTDHHTKPVLVFTMQWETHGRITQAHVDRNTSQLILRQSRLFDFRGPEPTADAYLFVRWMLNEPIGATAFEAAEEVGTGTPGDDSELQAQTLPVADAPEEKQAVSREDASYARPISGGLKCALQREGRWLRDNSVTVY